MYFGYPVFTNRNSGFQAIVIPHCAEGQGFAFFEQRQAFGEVAFAGCPLTNDVADLISPCVETFASQAFNSTARMCGRLVLTNLVSGGCDFSGCKFDSVEISSDRLVTLTGQFGAVSNVVIHTPNLLTIDAYTFGYAPITNDVADVIPAGVANMPGTGAFRSCPNLRGCLVLTNMVYIGRPGNDSYTFDNCRSLQEIRVSGPHWSTFDGNNVFGNCTSVTNVVLASPCLTMIPNGAFVSSTRIGTVDLQLPALTNIVGSAFYGCSALTNLTIAATNLTTVSPYAFWGCPFRSVTFLGPAPSPAAMSNLFFNVAADTKDTGVHPCTIYVSKHQAGWTKLIDRTFTAHESTNVPAGCLGVYTNSAGRKAWVVHKAVPADGLRYFYIHVR